MKTDRRSFLRTAAIAGASAVAATSLAGCAGSREVEGAMPGVKQAADKSHSQQFNMSGYTAPAVDTVHVGVIGLGMRGPGAVDRLIHIEGVKIVALCDKYPDRVARMQTFLTEKGLNKAKDFSGSEEAWKKLCEDPEIDLVYICTPWSWHTPMAVYAMECGKHAAVEVPAAMTLDQCWQLVETSERTRKHCMQLENCCYDFFELLTLNMVRQGFFGDIVHGEGSYIHDLRFLNFDKGESGYADMWRLKENWRNGNLYPTHGLGPICQAMNVNRGDRMDYLVSVSSNDFMMAAEVDRLAKDDPFFKPFAGKKYRGNMNTTTVRTILGRTIMIQHDVTSPRPYSRIHLLSGTDGVAQKYPSERIAKAHKWFSDTEMNEVEEKYTPLIVKKVGSMAKEVGGHGGMDFIMDWRLIDCLRNGLPIDQDVYDAALWSCITPLSEWSVANRSNSINVPDFTGGSWKTNKPVDPNLPYGGNTGILGVE